MITISGFLTASGCTKLMYSHSSALYLLTELRFLVIWKAPFPTHSTP